LRKTKESDSTLTNELISVIIIFAVSHDTETRVGAHDSQRDAVVAIRQNICRTAGRRVSKPTPLVKHHIKFCNTAVPISSSFLK